jgi:hypothetical protein
LKRDVLVPFEDDVLPFRAVVSFDSDDVDLLVEDREIRGHDVAIRGDDVAILGDDVDLLGDVLEDLGADVSFFGAVVSSRLHDVSLFLADGPLEVEDACLEVEDVGDEAEDSSEHRDVLGELLADRRSRPADRDSNGAVVDEKRDVLASLADERGAVCPVLTSRDGYISKRGPRRGPCCPGVAGPVGPSYLMHRKSRSRTVG